MARPERRNADYFPLWKPQKATSAFIKRRDVKEIIFKRDNYKCVFCKSFEKLTIDHIVSVYQVALGKFPLEKLNIRENLQILCEKCNSRKKP